jgi:glycosyltransferase involved in cell wall biosynthesis
MRIGILGTRGIPNAYGGFEQFAEFLALGLSQKGHEVYVYNSSLHPYMNDIWNNIHIIHCKDFEDKIGTAGQFIYDLNCIRDARKRKFDVLLQLGYTSNSIWHWPWPKDSVNIINMDGLEWKRSKYSASAQKFLKIAEKWAAQNGEILIADSIGIQQHLLQIYQRQSVFIPYGAHVFKSPDPDCLAEWNIEPHQYHLLIARMEPENNVEMIIKGHVASKPSFPLILIGNHANAFGQYLYKKYHSPEIRFIGGLYDQKKINNIRYFSALYFHGHSVGGTNPSLIEAMACGCNIAAHDNIFNKAVLGEAAFYFSDEGGVVAILKHNCHSACLTSRKRENMIKVEKLYNWETIIQQYEDVFLKAVGA